MKTSRLILEHFAAITMNVVNSKFVENVLNMVTLGHLPFYLNPINWFFLLLFYDRMDNVGGNRKKHSEIR